MMLEAVKMNPKYYQQMLREVAHHIMMGVYPEFDAASNRAFKKDTGIGSEDTLPADEVDYDVEKQGLSFVEKLVSLGSLDEIRKYCDGNHMKEYYPNESEYIEQAYKDMTEEGKS